MTSASAADPERTSAALADVVPGAGVGRFRAGRPLVPGDLLELLRGRHPDVLPGVAARLHPLVAGPAPPASGATAPTRGCGRRGLRGPDGCAPGAVRAPGTGAVQLPPGVHPKRPEPCLLYTSP